MLFVTMCREALDDYRRYRRDKEANSQMYRKLTRDGFCKVPSSDIQVGDLIVVDKVRGAYTGLCAFCACVPSNSLHDDNNGDNICVCDGQKSLNRYSTPKLYKQINN